MNNPAPHRSRTILRLVLVVLAIVFGVATILSGGNVLFGGDAARQAEGDVVPFVLKFNFGAGFLYVFSGAAVLLRQNIGLVVARVVATATVLVFIGLVVHIMIGRLFEIRTVVAMTLRSAFWIVFVVTLSRDVEYV